VDSLFGQLNVDHNVAVVNENPGCLAGSFLAQSLLPLPKCKASSIAFTIALTWVSLAPEHRTKQSVITSCSLTSRITMSVASLSAAAWAAINAESIALCNAGHVVRGFPISSVGVQLVGRDVVINVGVHQLGDRFVETNFTPDVGAGNLPARYVNKVAREFFEFLVDPPWSCYNDDADVFSNRFRLFPLGEAVIRVGPQD